MKTKIMILIAAAITLAGCTATPQMIEAQKGKCAQIGYAPGTPDFMACVERGSQMQEATQGAVAASAGSQIASRVIFDSLF